jgi:hypothetical protein
VPSIELTDDEVRAIRIVVIDHIDATKEFIEDTEPARLDHQRARQNLAILSAALPKLEHSHAQD